jgi:hypothetical protein
MPGAFDINPCILSSKLTQIEQNSPQMRAVLLAEDRGHPDPVNHPAKASLFYAEIINRVDHVIVEDSKSY